MQQRLAEPAGGSGHPAGDGGVEAQVVAGGEVGLQRGQRLRGGEDVVVVDEQDDVRSGDAGSPSAVPFWRCSSFTYLEVDHHPTVTAPIFAARLIRMFAPEPRTRGDSHGALPP